MARDRRPHRPRPARPRDPGDAGRRQGRRQRPLRRASPPTPDALRPDPGAGADRPIRTSGDMIVYRGDGRTGSGRGRNVHGSCRSTGDYLLIGAVAGVATFVVTPLVGALARWRGWLVRAQRPHGAHQADAGHRRAGDVHRASSWRSSWPACWTASTRCSPATPSRRASSSLPPIIVALGLADDIRGISAPAKVTGTVIAGLALVWFGVVDVLLPAAVPRGLLPLRRLAPAGHRALAARDDPGHQPDRRARRAGRRHRGHRRRAPSSSTASASPTSTSSAPPNIGPLIAIIAVGLCVGFLPHNFNPARIIMGDTRRAAARAPDGGRRPAWSAVAPIPTRRSSARPTSSWPRSSSRCSSSASRCSTCCSPSSAGPRAARRSTSPTRATSTTA